ARHPRAPHSFPTRRSSDLLQHVDLPRVGPGRPGLLHPDQDDLPRHLSRRHAHSLTTDRTMKNALKLELTEARAMAAAALEKARRSEEHTSELQSRENLVCR